MNRLFLSLISLAACMTSCTSPEPLTDYVDPRIGTAHSRWFFFTPAAVPFGMAKLAPTTDGHLGNPGGWQAVGYDARHTSIEGFANFHEFQVGGVVIAPTVGALQTVPGPLDDPEAGYRSRFDKKDEVARPGYYSVLLKDYGVKAELTATERVGFHRYTFPASEEANLIFNIGTKMGESGPARDASVTFTEDGRIEGWVVTEPVYVDIYQKGAVVKMYFSAVVDAEPASWGAFCGEEVFAGERSRTGVGAGVYLRFDTRARRDVGVKIGLSYTSVENARLNMQAEAADLDFDGALLAANEAWEEALGRIRVEGGKREDRVKFYTGLFHAVLGRGLASDVNGAYPANDGTVGQIPLDPAGNPLHNHYNTDAIWGGFWNLTQLWSIAYPEYYADWISSQLLVYKDAGWATASHAASMFRAWAPTLRVSLSRRPTTAASAISTWRSATKPPSRTNWAAKAVPREPASWMWGSSSSAAIRPIRRSCTCRPRPAVRVSRLRIRSNIRSAPMPWPRWPASWDMKPITNGFRSSPKGGNCSSTPKPN